MLLDILSLFPFYFQSPLNTSILKRAQEKGKVKINVVDIRDFAKGRHHQVDDRPYGGGPGMLLMPEPLKKAIDHSRKKASHVVYLSPKGNRLKADMCKRLAEKEHLILICGHYEGIDQRIIDQEVDEEISIGDYVLTNGCVAAIVLMDAMVRFIRGVLGNDLTVKQDSFEERLLDCPHYTRPEIFDGESVPKILLTGDHTAIETWRHQRALATTQRCRPDLYYAYLADRVGIDEDKSQREVSYPEFSSLITVQELNKSVKFYNKILGFKQIKDKRIDKATLRIREGFYLLLVEKDEQPQENNFQLKMESLDDLNFLQHKLARAKISFISCEEKKVMFKDLNHCVWSFYV